MIVAKNLVEAFVYTKGFFLRLFIVRAIFLRPFYVRVFSARPIKSTFGPNNRGPPVTMSDFHDFDFTFLSIIFWALWRVERVNWETKIGKICYIEAKLNLNNTNIPIIVNNQSHIPNYLAQSSKKIGTKLFGLTGPSVGQTSSKMI